MENLKLIFEKKQLFSFFLTSIFIILSMILESLSIGLIFPILSLLIDTSGNQNDFFIFLYEKLNFFQISSKLVFYLLFFVFVYLLKIGFLIFFSWYKNKLLWDTHNYLSKKIYKKYLEQDINFFKNKSTGEIIRDLTSEISMFISNGVAPIIIIISNSFTLFGFVIVFLIINYKVTLILIVLNFSFAYLFHFSNKFLLIKWGLKRHINEGLRISYLNQGINSIKEAKIYGKEKWFLDKFDKYNKLTFNSLKNYDFFKTLPKFFIEIIILISTVAIIIFFYQEQVLNQSLPFFGALCIGFFRAMPIVSQMLVSLQSLNYVKSAYDLVVNSLNLNSENSISENNYTALDFKNSIEIKNLTLFYENKNNLVLNNINLSISKGDCIGIVGESGARKSTFVDLLMGLIKPNNGNITVDGKNIFSNLKNWQKLIGYVPQSIYLIDDSIKKNIAFGEDEKNINLNRLKQSIENVELVNLVNNTSEKEDTIIGEKGAKLSGGERQRIAIARSIYIDPEVMIFDEATSALDLDTESKIVESIDKLSKNKTVIIISHRISTLKKCNKIYEIKKGNMSLLK